MDLPELIEWHEGMLLSPQHFQQIAARHELLSHFLFTQAAPFAWGIRKLQIDETALGAGLLSILNLEAILPDGLLILAGSERGAKLEFDLAKAQGDIVRVYLQVPPDPAVYARSESSRYRGVPSNGHVESDGVSGSEAIPIPHVRPKIQLFPDDVNLRGMTTLPLLEFARKGAVCPEDSRLHRTGSAGRAGIGSGQSMRAGDPTGARQGNQPWGKGEFQWRRQRCKRHLSTAIADLLPADGGSATGERSGASLHAVPCPLLHGRQRRDCRAMPACRIRSRPYDHDNLLKSFDWLEVLGFIRQAISEGIVDHWIARELQPAHGDSNSKRLWLGPQLEDAFGAGANWSAPFFGLVVNAPARTPPEEFVRWGETCLLASEDLISDLARERSLGTSCERVDRLEDLTGASRIEYLFRVKNEPAVDRWEEGAGAPAREAETRRPHFGFVLRQSTVARDKGRLRYAAADTGRISSFARVPAVLYRSCASATGNSRIRSSLETAPQVAPSPRFRRTRNSGRARA